VVDVLTPGDEAELAEAVAQAAAAKTPLEIRGGGTRAALGRSVQAEKTLSTAGLSGISLYEPGALTLVARGGTPVAEIEAALGAEGQMLPFEPMDHRALLGSTGEPTIGGVVACGVSGPRRIAAGACRDAMLGLRFVNGRGEVVKSGGRVMKNVTGLDLPKLLCGSYGTLGVITEVAFKVLPKPEAEATLARPGLDPAEAVMALGLALTSPYGVTGAAQSAGQALVRIEGLEGSVAHRAKELRALLGAGWETVEGGDSAPLWQDVRDVAPFAGGEGAVWRVSVKPSDGPVLGKRLEEAGLAHEALYDWGGGLVWLQVAEQDDAGTEAIRAAVAALGGHATLVRASAATRAAVEVFQPEPGPLDRVAAGLRAKFDPAGVLNPGRMGA
jgi:glycolate oxidase FAD binding subunit